MKLLTCCWSRQKDVSPALPSVPGEVLRDIRIQLDRWTLDGVQFTCPRFLRLITERMSGVCLREVRQAVFNASDKYYMDTPKGASFFIFVYHRRTLEMRLVFTPELAAIVLRTPIVAESLSVIEGNCADLTPTQFHKVVLHFSPTRLCVDRCPLRACQINSEFLRALCKNRVLCSSFSRAGPVDGDSFHVTDDALVEFCAQSDVQIDQEREQLEELELQDGSFTKDLFKRLVEAHSVSMRTQPLRITVSPLRFEDEDLRDFAQYLSYRNRGSLWPMRTYNFPCEQ
ncbi:hypothetical protein AAVH_37294, partial [Aphelenchoides avenae]